MSDIPKGKLIVIGGAVDKGTVDDSKVENNSELKFFELGILARLMKELKGRTHRVEVVTTASEMPEEIGIQYVNAYKLLKHENIGVMHIKNREDACREEYLEKLKEK